MHIISFLCKSRKIFAFFSFLILSTQLLAQTKTLGLTKKVQGNDEDGYILFAPIGVDTTYLMNKCGQRLHQWNTKYTPGFSVYLKPNGNLLKAGVYNDTSFGTAGGRGGIIEEYDWNGNLVWSYIIFNDSLCQHHDIVPMDNGNILVLAWHSVSKSRAQDLGRLSSNFNQNVNELWGERIIELRPYGSDSAEIVWQWDLFDHIIQDQDTALSNYGDVSQHPELININYAHNLKTYDWVHANSLDYNKELDQIVISAHNFSEIWIIDHSTSTAEAASHSGGNSNRGGDILYRWGNPQAYNQGLSSDRKLFRQHNARWIPNGMRDSGCILIFNNGQGRSIPYSSIDIINTPVFPDGSYNSNLPYGPPNPTWTYQDSKPTDFYSAIISGSQMLPNGNVLICSGVQGRLFEVTPSKSIVWEYRNPVHQAGIQADGETAGFNSVFRCSYYPKKYSAFNNKNLSPKGTIEKNSFAYSCSNDKLAPTLVYKTPKNNDTAVNLNEPLVIHFNERIKKKSGTVYIYQNNSLLEAVNMDSDLVVALDTMLLIKHNNAFAVNARIAVAFGASLISDTVDNVYTKSIDSSTWHFRTIRSLPLSVQLFPAHLSSNNTLNTSIRITYNKDVFKRGGSIRLFENGQAIETIPVSSNQVNISGKVVSIKPSVLFNPNTLIVISMDSCFMDNLGYPVRSINYGDWYFNTAKAALVTSTSPIKGSVNNAQTSSLNVNFSRTLAVQQNLNVSIFENGQLKAAIPLNDSKIQLSGNSLQIAHGLSFQKGARVAVSIPANGLIDTFGIAFAGVDTANWYFSIEKASSISGLNQETVWTCYPNPSRGQFTLQSSAVIEQVQVYTLTGKELEVLLEPVDANHYTIRLENPSPGLYLLRVNGEQNVWIQIE